MLSLEEQEKLRKPLSMISEEVPKGSEVSNWLRDQQGKFLLNESKSEIREELPSRSIKVVKVKGTYGTYLIKERVFEMAAFHMLITIGTIAFITIIAWG